jgi:hypothetical protein
MQQTKLLTLHADYLRMRQHLPTPVRLLDKLKHGARHNLLHHHHKQHHKVQAAGRQVMPPEPLGSVFSH